MKSLCMIILYLVPIKKIKGQVPEQLEVLEVVPGFTLGGIYAARYWSRGRDFVSEFGLMQSYVRFGDKKGFFIDHFCMDKNPASEGCSGSFSWGGKGRLVTLNVSAEGADLIDIKMRPLIKDIPFTGTLPFLCLKGNNVVYHHNHFISRIGISLSKVVLPSGSHLRDFPFGPKLFTVFWDTSNIVFQEPEYVGQRVMKQKNAMGTPMGSNGDEAHLNLLQEQQKSVSNK
ncbi:MAG: hypothetical protein ACYDFU_09850 [Nitrospirota bacterium]